MKVANGGDAHDELLTEIHAADLLRLSVRTLQAWRTKGLGPAFVRAGRAVRYRRRDLITWIEAHTVLPTRAA
jgi:DNA-binding transcriptional MerR regulator